MSKKQSKWGDKLQKLCMKYNWNYEILYFFVKKLLHQQRKELLEEVEREINKVIDRKANLIKDLRIVESVALRHVKRDLNKALNKLKERA